MSPSYSEKLQTKSPHNRYYPRPLERSPRMGNTAIPNYAAEAIEEGIFLDPGPLPICDQCGTTGRLARQCPQCNSYTGFIWVTCGSCNGTKFTPDKLTICLTCKGIGLTATLCWRCGGCRWVFGGWCDCERGKLREQQPETIAPSDVLLECQLEQMEE
jgi:ribosomal protein L32